VNTLQALVLPLLPLPLFYIILTRGHYRRCLLPFAAVFGIYVFTCLGSPVVVADHELYSNTYFFTMLLVVACCYVLYAVLFALRSAVFVDYSSVVRVPDLSLTLALIVPLWAYSVAMLLLYISRHGAPPLFSLTPALQFVDLYKVRAEKTTSLPEGAHWYVLGLQTVPFFTFIYTYLIKRLTNSLGARVLFYANAMAVVVFAASFANKGIILTMMFYLVGVRLGLGKGGLRLRQLVGYGAVGFASLFLFIRLYLLDRGFEDVARIFTRYMADRILFAYAQAHAYIVQIVPREHPFFNGTAFANPGGVLPFTPVDLSQFLGYRTLGHLANYSTPSFTQGYANFGWIGIGLIVGLMGLQVIILQVLFRRLPKNPLFFAMYVLLFERMTHYGAEPLQNVLSEEFVLFLILVTLLYYAAHALLVDIGRSVPVRAYADGG